MIKLETFTNLRNTHGKTAKGTLSFPGQKEMPCINQCSQMGRCILCILSLIIFRLTETVATLLKQHNLHKIMKWERFVVQCTHIAL